jgi:hypothetical protein
MTETKPNPIDARCAELGITRNVLAARMADQTVWKLQTCAGMLDNFDSDGALMPSTIAAIERATGRSAAQMLGSTSPAGDYQELEEKLQAALGRVRELEAMSTVAAAPSNELVMRAWLDHGAKADALLIELSRAAAELARVQKEHAEQLATVEREAFQRGLEQPESEPQGHHDRAKRFLSTLDSAHLQPPQQRLAHMFEVVWQNGRESALGEVEVLNKRLDEATKASAGNTPEVAGLGKLTHAQNGRLVDLAHEWRMAIVEDISGDKRASAWAAVASYVSGLIDAASNGDPDSPELALLRRNNLELRDEFGQLRADHEAAGKAHAATVAELEGSVSRWEETAESLQTELDAWRVFANHNGAPPICDTDDGGQRAALRARLQPAPIPDALKLTEGERVRLHSVVFEWAQNDEDTSFQKVLSVFESLIAARVLRPMTVEEVLALEKLCPVTDKGGWGTPLEPSSLTEFANACRVGIGAAQQEPVCSFCGGGYWVCGNHATRPHPDKSECFPPWYASLVERANRTAAQLDHAHSALAFVALTLQRKPLYALADESASWRKAWSEVCNLAVAAAAPVTPGAEMTDEEHGDIWRLLRDWHDAIIGGPRKPQLEPHIDRHINAMLAKRMQLKIVGSYPSKVTLSNDGDLSFYAFSEDNKRRVYMTLDEDEGVVLSLVQRDTGISEHVSVDDTLVCADQAVAFLSSGAVPKWEKREPATVTPPQPSGNSGELTREEEAGFLTRIIAHERSASSESLGQLLAYVASLRAPLVSEVERLRVTVREQQEAADRILADTPAEPTEEEFAAWAGMFTDWTDDDLERWTNMSEQAREVERNAFRAARAGVRVRLREVSDAELGLAFADATDGFQSALDDKATVASLVLAFSRPFARAIIAAAQGEKP